MNKGGKYNFETAAELLEAANSYFDWCDGNPIKTAYKTKVSGSNKPNSREKRDEYATRPYTFEGLCVHMHITNWTKFVQDNESREGFGDVFGYIRNRVRQNQIEGGMVGLYNANLTARLNGIAENIVTNNETPPPSVIEKIEYDRDKE